MRDVKAIAFSIRWTTLNGPGSPRTNQFLGPAVKPYDELWSTTNQCLGLDLKPMQFLIADYNEPWTERGFFQPLILHNIDYYTARISIR